MIFVDTNYFLRFLLKDNTKQHNQAKELFNSGVQGKCKLFSSTIVYFEIYWVLHSFYGKNKKELCAILENILRLEFIDFEEREILFEAVDLFKDSNLSLEDCYNYSYSKHKKATDIKTFDQILHKKFYS